MKVISLLNAKGGVGKTTLSILIATCLARMGYKVCIVDTDPQGSVSNWANENTPFDILEASTDREIYGLRRRLKYYHYVIVDGAAAISSISAAAVMVSDLVLIPVTASPLDFSACGAILAVIEARQELAPVEARFVITKQVRNASMNKTLKQAIEATGIHPLKTGTTHKQDYVKGLMGGNTIYDLKSSSVKGEIDNLVSEILNLVA